MKKIEKPLQIIANGNEYSVNGVLYPNGKVKINKGSLISRNINKIVVPQYLNTRNEILSTKVTNDFCLKEDIIFNNCAEAETIITGSMRSGSTAFKTLDGVMLNDYFDSEENNLRILFCNIAYMEYYDGRALDKPINGGSYVKENEDAYEKYNFKEENGYYYGFVETKHHGESDFNQLHIEKIDESFKNKDHIEHVLVVLCAKPHVGSTVIVGWYKDATVYRLRPEINGRIYNLKAKIFNSRLLRIVERRFVIPRAKSNEDGIGFGQSNIWYASSKNSSDLINQVLAYINNKSNHQFLDEDILDDDNNMINDLLETNPNFDFESVPLEPQKPIFEKGRVVWPRNHTLKIRALAKANYKCEVDEGHFTFKRRNNGFDYTEGHHLIPLTAQSDSRFSNVNLDCLENIVSLCSNCHNELHYGNEPEKLLKILFEERKDKLATREIIISFEELLDYYK